MSENDLDKGVGKPLIVAGLGDVRFLQRLCGNKLIATVPQLVENIIAFAHDSAWGETFLADTAVQTHLILLMNHPTLPSGAATYLNPGKWFWTTPAMPSDFTPEAAQQWVYAHKIYIP